MDQILNPITPQQLQQVLARHLAMYRSKTPYYQATMLSSILRLWQGRHRRVLDIGAGTGVIAQAVSEMFPVDNVEAIDMVDRFCTTLSIPARLYDGRSLPYPDGHFDGAMLNNVVHHVKLGERAALLREIRRVVSGPLYIKDHETTSRLDSIRLAVLDGIGNVPFGGMLCAEYLTRDDWEELAGHGGYQIAARTGGDYRSGAYAMFFPNRLEVTMLFETAISV